MPQREVLENYFNEKHPGNWETVHQTWSDGGQISPVKELHILNFIVDNLQRQVPPLGGTGEVSVIALLGSRKNGTVFVEDCEEFPIENAPTQDAIVSAMKLYSNRHSGSESDVVGLFVTGKKDPTQIEALMRDLSLPVVIVGYPVEGADPFNRIVVSYTVSPEGGVQLIQKIVGDSLLD